MFAEFVPPDYATARGRFREALSGRASVESHAVPGGPDLTIDVARLGLPDAERLVIVSSGLHGGEGPFGSGVQLALLARDWPRDVALLLIHALNPFGYHHVRRTDADNVDLNRNFLLPGREYERAPPHYETVDRVVNPVTPPWIDLFVPRLWWLRKRLGEPALRHAIASGQAVNPRGLFYRGTGKAPTQRILDEHLPRWVGTAQQVIHLDFHTGLGPRGGRKLLVSLPPDSPRLARWRTRYGDLVETCLGGPTAYVTPGGIDEWCEARFPGIEFDSACGEFGTVPTLEVISTLRQENLAWHCTPEGSPQRAAARERMREAFVPSEPAWRERVIGDAVALVQRAAG